MSLTTLRNCFTAVSAQLSRFRPFPTAQTMKALGARGLKLTVTRLVQLLNAQSPTSVNFSGSLIEVIALHPENALCPTLVNELGSVREVIPLQLEYALFPTLVNDSGSVSEVILQQSWNAKIPTLVNEFFGIVREVILLQR